MRVIEVIMARRRNERTGETGDPRENPPTNGIVRHDSHMRKSGVTRLGIEYGSSWCEASRLTAQPPRLRRSAGMQGQVERENPENTRQPAASSSTIITCENPGATSPGIESGSPWWEAVTLAATLPRPLEAATTFTSLPETGYKTVNSNFFDYSSPARQYHSSLQRRSQSADFTHISHTRRHSTLYWLVILAHLWPMVARSFQLKLSDCVLGGPPQIKSSCWPNLEGSPHPEAR
ncbi:hypothetical protein PR048_009634 [Dryococelus australis]|uniref:Uncharacterized protein n=1 Tax=Dryococelus australis TaxID=614101 RepID=A0ABQ9I0G3_9NEOP|nr:hypothetical protein PR048_009634 [Dryococelus australis]